MDQSYSDSDISLSPSQILERLQVLRRLQLLQRGKLQKQRLQYQETGDTSSNSTEIISRFSNSTSYNTFRSLLQSSEDASNEVTPRSDTSNLSPKVKQKDLLEGVSVLNLSQESEFIVTSPVSRKSTVSATSGNVDRKSPMNTSEVKYMAKKQISLDEMPILSPKHDFEALILEKLKTEKCVRNTSQKTPLLAQNKKPFLRRGEGLTRFGLKINNLVIQNTKALPWKRKGFNKNVRSPLIKQTPKIANERVEVEILVTEPETTILKNNQAAFTKLNRKEKCKPPTEAQDNQDTLIDSSNCEMHCANNKPAPKLNVPKAKRTFDNKGNTWAAVLNKEQDDFLRQLKQSDYYKNFVSPAKSCISDISCDENLIRLRQEREKAEQNMFELLETKVSNDSFSIENSFFNKFLRTNKFECSGDSTPLIMQKCLSNNPELMHIFPDINHKRRNKNSQTEIETCNSECTDCCSDDCSVSSCCSCKTIESANNNYNVSKVNNNKEGMGKKDAQQKGIINKKSKEAQQIASEKECQDDNVTENDTMKANMAEMNAKLVATSELLKDRLRELEDEIETFRKENTNLAKLREEVDLERQKFYEEKSLFQQKFNEEKILSEYYLSEEKDKLSKQKQTYERYVKEMRGRLNKKEKDEVVNLKKEINELKEEIRIKDAKSTSTIARLRNQIKIMEKEKKDLQDNVEKLKKENRRIQHSNDITRRLSNMKYLEQINKKMTNMSCKESRSKVNIDNDSKYKAYEIERQSRSRRVQAVPKDIVRPRAKSVPNLKVTSRYAKYFSQRDVLSQMDRSKLNGESPLYHSDNDANDNETAVNDRYSSPDTNSTDNEIDDNHLEKIYMERFQSSPTSNRSSLCNSNAGLETTSFKENPDPFFIRKSKSSSIRNSNSPNTSQYLHNGNGSNTNRTKSPISILSNRSGNRSFSPSINKETISNYADSNYQKSKSPVSILSNHSSNTRLTTVISQENCRDKLMNVSPEPSTSKTSLIKTSLNPTEIKKPDGSKELRFPNGNLKYISADGKYSKFMYYNGDVKENFYDDGRIKYFYAEAKTHHTTYADGLEVMEFPDGQVEKRYKDGSSEIRLPNGSIRYFDPKNEHVREEWRFPDGAALTVSANGDQRIAFANGQIEVHTKDHKRREFPDGTVKLVYNDGTSETRYASGRVRIKDKHGNLIMDSSPG